jgi:hypothetical protein
MHMHTRRIIATFAVAAAATIMSAAVSSAAASPAVSIEVLSYGTPGAPVVTVGSTIGSTTLASPATFVNGAIGTTCTASAFTAQVLTNPVAPGTAATRLLTQTFGGCTSTIPGSSVISVTVTALPNTLQFNDSSGLPLAVTPPPAGPLGITILESTSSGTVPCVWQPAAGIYNGNYGNSGNMIIIGKQTMTLVGGPPGPCGGTSQIYTVIYKNTLDVTTSGLLFVN